MSDLVNRKKLGNAVDIRLAEGLKELSNETKIPCSRLLDEAIQLLLERYNKKATDQ